MIKKYIIIIAAVISIISCSIFSESNSTTPGKSRVSFTVPETTNGLIPEELIYIDLNAEYPILQHVSVQSGNIDIELSKGGTHLLALVNSSRTARSIGGQISTIGNIGIIANGLDSLPISDIGADQIDLGEINLNDDTFESDMSADTASNELGYPTDALESFGAYDDVTLKFLNPDINRNGRYDVEEYNFNWGFGAIPYFSIPITSEEYDNDIMPITPSEIQNYSAGFSIVFGPMGQYDSLTYDDLDNIKLIFPEDLELYDFGGNRVYYVVPHHADSSDIQFGIGGMFNPEPPYDGDYKIQIYDTIYYIDNVRFIKPENNYENFAFPIFKQTVGQDNFIKSVSWKWKIVKNSVFRDASPEEVKLQVKKMNIHWELNNGDVYYIEPSPPDFYLGGIAYPEKQMKLDDGNIVFTFQDMGYSFYFWMNQ